MSEELGNIGEIRVDTDNLYREEVITDLKVGSIHVLTPIKTDGSPDPSREQIFTGQAQLMSQAGMLPVSCRIEATSLEDATAKFPQAIQAAVERLVDEARELQRREASRIVVPGAVPLGGPGGKLDLV